MAVKVSQLWNGNDVTISQSPIFARLRQSSKYFPCWCEPRVSDCEDNIYKSIPQRHDRHFILGTLHFIFWSAHVTYSHFQLVTHANITRWTHWKVNRPYPRVFRLGGLRQFSVLRLAGFLRRSRFLYVCSFRFSLRPGAWTPYLSLSSTPTWDIIVHMANRWFNTVSFFVALIKNVAYSLFECDPRAEHSHLFKTTMNLNLPIPKTLNSRPFGFLINSQYIMKVKLCCAWQGFFSTSFYSTPPPYPNPVPWVSLPSSHPTHTRRHCDNFYVTQS